MSSAPPGAFHGRYLVYLAESAYGLQRSQVGAELPSQRRFQEVRRRDPCGAGHDWLVSYDIYIYIDDIDDDIYIYTHSRWLYIIVGDYVTLISYEIYRDIRLAMAI